jgi:chloramphenicol 3-O-phosphotransferase
MGQVTGRVFIALNGQRIRSKEGASLDVGGVTREPSVSDAGVDGFMEKIMPPKVDCKISHTANTSMAALQNFTGTLTFQTDTGRIFTLIEAWNANPPKLEKGEITLEFCAVECQET